MHAYIYIYMCFFTLSFGNLDKRTISMYVCMSDYMFYQSASDYHKLFRPWHGHKTQESHHMRGTSQLLNKCSTESDHWSTVGISGLAYESNEWTVDRRIYQTYIPLTLLQNHLGYPRGTMPRYGSMFVKGAGQFTANVSDTNQTVKVTRKAIGKLSP